MNRILPAARTRIVGWMLLLMMAALAVATLATWRLLVATVNDRMDGALRVEVEEFNELIGPGINPSTGAPFTGSKNSSARPSPTTSPVPTKCSSATSTEPS